MENKYFGGNRLMNDPVLAIGSGGNTEKVSTTALDSSGQTVYTIDGIIYNLADGDHALTAASLATAYTALLLIQVNAAGTVSSKLGTAVLTATLAAGNDVLQYPKPDAGNVAIGYVKIANATGSAFVVGTTGLDTVSITDTYYSVAQPPTAPQTS